jgi:hypothetical protein
MLRTNAFSKVFFSLSFDFSPLLTLFSHKVIFLFNSNEEKRPQLQPLCLLCYWPLLAHSRSANSNLHKERRTHPERFLRRSPISSFLHGTTKAQENHQTEKEKKSPVKEKKENGQCMRESLHQGGC